MNKKIMLIAMSIFLVSFVFAAQGEQNGLSNDTPIGISAGMGEPNLYGENEGAQERIQERIMVRDGNFTGVGGKKIKISKQENNECHLEVGGATAKCGVEVLMEEDEDGNRTRLFAKLSNGRNAEIKIMPDTASETALNRLRIKNCNESNGCTIQLKEAGSGNESKMTYEVRAEKQSRLFWVFRKKMEVNAEVDAETGEIIKSGKPWWAFLASEPEETE